MHGLEVWDDVRCAITTEGVYPSFKYKFKLVDMPYVTGRYFTIRQSQRRYTFTIPANIKNPRIAISLDNNYSVTLWRTTVQSDGSLFVSILAWTEAGTETEVLIFGDPDTVPYGLSMYTASGEVVSDFNKLLHPVAYLDGSKSHDNMYPIDPTKVRHAVLFSAPNYYREVERFDNPADGHWVWILYYFYYRSGTTFSMRRSAREALADVIVGVPVDSDAIYYEGAPPLLIDVTGY